MDKLPEEEISRIHALLLEDERSRNRGQFVYAFDILKRNWAVPFSIWPLPNADALRVINGEVDYNDLPFEDQNEAEKGIFFEDQRQFVAQHNIPGEPMLCEAMGHKICLQEKCPLFKPKDSKEGGPYGICAEYKIAFRK
ncbi:hypothetical protein AMJ49_01240 [Parcubacteria bacterium DG_74_2]|nr:MAG: hypothetical protein AMJ49_01240 [Parcubacteria bacterium DG_74_2]